MSADGEQAVILLFTDGSCIKNPGGPSGWAYVAVRDGVKLSEAFGCIANGTNNQGELTACVEALKEAAELHRQYPEDRLVIVSDSRYVLGGLPHSDEWGWDRNRPNRELWNAVYKALCSVGTTVSLKWVRGHTGNPNNERCDKLAYNAARRQISGKWKSM